MTEVFRTNVTSMVAAKRIVTAIHNEFDAYRANFDLQDCDRILRVCTTAGEVLSDSIRIIVEAHGFYAEILPDDIPESEFQESLEYSTKEIQGNV